MKNFKETVFKKWGDLKLFFVKKTTQHNNPSNAPNEAEKKQEAIINQTQEYVHAVATRVKNFYHEVKSLSEKKINEIKQNQLKKKEHDKNKK